MHLLSYEFSILSSSGKSTISCLPNLELNKARTENCEWLRCWRNKRVCCVTFPHFLTCARSFRCFPSSTSKFFPPTCFIQCKCMLLHSVTFASEWSIWNFLSCRQRAYIRFETGEREDPSICINVPPAFIHMSAILRCYILGCKADREKFLLFSCSKIPLNFLKLFVRVLSQSVGRVAQSV